jgi:acyl carrier protein
MTDEDILNRLTVVLRDVLLDDSIQLTMKTTREEVPAWDSFSYINFIVGVEMRFGMKFSVADVESFKNVGEIVQAVRMNPRMA